MIHFADIEQEPSGRVINIYVQTADGTMRSIQGTVEAKLVDGYVTSTFVHESKTEGRQTFPLEYGWEKELREMAEKFGNKVLLGSGKFLNEDFPVLKRAVSYDEAPKFKKVCRENNNWRKKGRGFNGYNK